MKYMAIILAVLLMAGSSAMPASMQTRVGDEAYSEPLTGKNNTLILADEGGDGPALGEPSPEEARNAVLV